MEFVHKSVLLNESIKSLNIKSDGIYVDGTAGGAGHSCVIASKLTSGKLIALDQDPDAITVAAERLKGYPALVVQSNFKDIDKVLNELGIEKIDGIFLDLGVSSYQLDNAERGFSYHADAPIDMRMSKEGVSAKDIVNGWTVEDLSRIFFDYGEEKFAINIARRIEKVRKEGPIETTRQLAEIIAKAVPAAARRDGHPARKCFQAIRIAVNGELESLREILDKSFDLLNQNGVLSIITFQSLEDRMVKQKFKELCTGCTCPPDFPVCVCGKQPKGKLYNKKPITASEEELKENPRSRSANLRAIIKL